MSAKPIVGVETRLCNGVVVGRNHKLTNRTEGDRLVTYCQFCLAEWPVLDAEMRAEAGPPPEYHKKGARPGGGAR